MKISPAGIGISSNQSEKIAVAVTLSAAPWVTPTLILDVLDTYGRLNSDGQYYNIVFPTHWVGTLNDDDTDPFKAYRDGDDDISKTVDYIINIPASANVGSNVDYDYTGTGSDYRLLTPVVTFQMDGNFADAATVGGSTITVNNAGMIIGRGGKGGDGGADKDNEDDFGGGGGGGAGMHQTSPKWYGGYGGAAGGTGSNKGANTGVNWFHGVAAGGSGGGDPSSDIAPTRGGYGGNAFWIDNGDGDSIAISIINNNDAKAYIHSGGGGGGGAETGAGGDGGLSGDAGVDAADHGGVGYRGLAGKLFYNEENDSYGDYSYTVTNYHVTGNTAGRNTVKGRGQAL